MMASSRRSERWPTGNDPLASSGAAATVESAVASATPTASGPDDMAVAPGAGRAKRGSWSRPRSQGLLLALLACAALFLCDGGGTWLRLLPSAAAQPEGDDGGAPFPISTTSKGLGRRRRASPVQPQHVLMASINELAHIKPLTALGRELVRRGHRVTFVAPESCLLGLNTSAGGCLVDTKGWFASQLPQATFVSAGQAKTAAEREAEAPPDLARAVLYALQTVSNVNEAILATLLQHFGGGGGGGGGGGKQQQQSQSQQQQQQPAPDMVVADFLTTAAVDAADALGLPLVVNNPFPICHDLTEPQGIMVPVHAFPAPLRSLETFKGRVANLINHFLWLGVGLYAARLRNLLRAKHGLPRLSLMDQLSFRASPAEGRAWILQNTVFGLEVPRVLDPRTHMLGPLLLPPSAGGGGGGGGSPSGAGDGGCPTSGQPGAKECKAVMGWLNRRAGRERGVIYVSLAEPLASAPLELVREVMKALSSDQVSRHLDVLWVLDDASRLGLERPVPPHMLAVPAAPHLEALRHPRVKALVSQAALEAVSEALWHGLPVVGLPLRGYDRGACTLAQDAGAARCLLPTGPKAWTRPETIVEAVLEVAGIAADGDGNGDGDGDGGKGKAAPLRVSPCQAHARRLGAIMQGAGGVPRAADLVELAARVGLSHLQQPRLEIGLGLGTTWLSGSMVDVRLALFLVLLLSYWALALAVRLARRLLRWTRYLAKQQGEEEQGQGQGQERQGQGRGPSPSLNGPSGSQPPRSRPGSMQGTPQPPSLHPSISAPGGLDRPSPRTNGSGSGNGNGNGSGNGNGANGSSGRGERPPLPPGSNRDR